MHSSTSQGQSHAAADATGQQLRQNQPTTSCGTVTLRLRRHEHPCLVMLAIPKSWQIHTKMQVTHTASLITAGLGNLRASWGRAAPDDLETRLEDRRPAAPPASANHWLRRQPPCAPAQPPEGKERKTLALHRPRSPPLQHEALRSKSRWLPSTCCPNGCRLQVQPVFDPAAVCPGCFKAKGTLTGAALSHREVTCSQTAALPSLIHRGARRRRHTTSCALCHARIGKCVQCKGSCMAADLHSCKRPSRRHRGCFMSLANAPGGSCALSCNHQPIIAAITSGRALRSG